MKRVSALLLRVVGLYSFFVRKSLILTFLLAFITNIIAQNQESVLTRKISIEANNENLSSVLRKIQQSGHCIINFTSDDVNGFKVTVSAKEKTVKQVLDDIMAHIYQQPFTYNVGENVISIIKTKKNVQPQPPGVQIAKGKVTDSHNDPLLGVNVRVKGTTAIGTVTDINGGFILKIPEEIKNPVLVFTFVGMSTKEIPYNVDFMNVVLTEGVELSEVVVMGIFNRPKESFTGAVTSMTSKELKQAGNRSVVSSIRNIDPSFRIADNIMIGSDPNSMPTITMRGSTSFPTGIKELQVDSKSLREANQPLFILNGFEVGLERIMDLDENQIETINLLKDASSTALYGTRGSNGVVVITTRRPESGKIQLTYNGSLNIEAPDLRPYNLMNAWEKLEYEKIAGLYYSQNADNEQNLLDMYNRRKNDVERGVNTYWIKYPVRTGVGSRHALRIEGGEETFRYAGAISYNNVAGAMKGSKRNTFNGNMHFIYNLKNLIFQNDLQIVSSKSKNSPYGNFADYTRINSYYKPYDDNGNLVKYLENYTLYQTDSKYLPLSYTRQTVYNPLYDALQPSKDESEYQQIVNNFSIEWHILPKELFVRGRFNVTTEKNRKDTYISAKHSMFDQYSAADFDRKGKYTYNTGNKSTYEGDITLNYSKTFNAVHQIYAGLGYNIAESKYEDYATVGEGITVINMDFLGMASKYEKEGRPGGMEGITRRAGVIFNGNYTYDRRYFVDFSGSVEGSSQFGADNRYAPFWSTGFGWNINNESFLKNNEIIKEARLRFSYGITGSQSFSPYQALLTYKDSGGKNYMGWYGTSIMGMGNKDLGWQKTRQYNIGADYRLYDGRIRLNVDVYNRITDNLLADVNLPLSSGFSSYRANVGKVENKGFEVGANFYILENRKHDFSWAVGGTLIHNKNKIKEISNSLEFLNEKLSAQESINPSFMYKEGESMQTIYAVKSKGIDPSNGKEVFIKQDGTETYIWDPKDKVACGDGEHKYIGNINTTVRYKGFTLTGYFGYRLGGYMYNSTLANKVENIVPYENADKRAYYNRWKKPGDITPFKGVNEFSRTYATSRFVMKENLFTGQSLSLTYEFPSLLAKKYLGCQYLAVKGYLEDFFYLSSIKREVGINYPYARKFSMTITTRF